MKRSVVLVVGLLLGFASVSQAATVTLDDTVRCGANNASNGIVVGDVTGNNAPPGPGPATECWGTFNGNNSQDTLVRNGTNLSEIAKLDFDDGLSGADIGLVVSGPAENGTWSFDPNKPDAPDGADFYIVLKASSSPGYAVWLFAGNPANTSFSGSYHVAWGNDLSHLSVYTGPPDRHDVPVSGTLSLVGLGLLGLRLRRRKR